MKRAISEKIQKHLEENKLLVLLGPRGNKRVNLIQSILKTENIDSFNLNNKKEKKLLENLTLADLPEFFNGKKHLIIHEAQVLVNLEKLVEYVLFEDLPINLVLICSFLPNLQEDLLAALKLQDLLITFHSPTFQEFANEQGVSNFDLTIEDKLLFGNLSANLETKDEKIAFLTKQVDLIVNEPFSENNRINKKENLLKMLQYLSFKIGEHLSYNEIAEKCALDNETVERYCDLLVKAYVLIKIPVFYNENKYELKKTNCFYFYDNGIRNAIIQHFNSFDLRLDQLSLWKNWLIAEKYKQLDLEKETFYFWKTHTGQTIDLLIKNENSSIKGFQFQYNKNEKLKLPKSFTLFYPEIKVSLLNKSTYWTFLTPSKR